MLAMMYVGDGMWWGRGSLLTLDAESCYTLIDSIKGIF